MTRSVDIAVRRAEPFDLPAVRELVDQDPVGNVFVAARIGYATANGALDPLRLGGEILVYAPRGVVESLCFVGGNLVPVAAGPAAIEAFGDRLVRRTRLCASLVGEADAVLSLWDLLEE